MATKQKKGSRQKRSRHWGIKLAVAALVLLVGVTFIPAMFIPAGPIGDTYLALVGARKRSVELAKETGETAVTKVAAEVSERRETGSSTANTDQLTICSFNIQFLGSSKSRDDVALASILKGYDVVVVQELVSPPHPALFPDGSPVKPDPEAAEFFDAMKDLGFDYWLSEEDTGTGDRHHNNGSATEWWVVFYRDDNVDRAMDLPHGFLADDRSNHDDYERVPYAFSFRASEGMTDFVLISVHLQPGSGRKDKARRKHELGAISGWIGANDAFEKDFIILGDCNIENAGELTDTTPDGFMSLNDECRSTNTNVNGPKPYDHIFYRPESTPEMDTGFDMAVVDLVKAMQPMWHETATFPGEPYRHNEFRKWYSDHNPVVFRLHVEKDDD
ncbi:MAG: hypothetical protein HN742_35190 [Lentisphaerae bacterium]|nr:hypothetical protein [Lentisphaerota bacterium]MBT7055203.1 hypothetical protein [Lentisphaerota bacterium]MBT7847168.1 hypothetical protein [Lentisphaerota bacterium]